MIHIIKNTNIPIPIGPKRIPPNNPKNPATNKNMPKNITPIIENVAKNTIPTIIKSNVKITKITSTYLI
jgi:hypothetical protein